MKVALFTAGETTRKGRKTEKYDRGQKYEHKNHEKLTRKILPS
jgi:hypothetical protein